MKKELKAKINNLSNNTSNKTTDVSSSAALDSTFNNSKSTCNQSDSSLFKSPSDCQEFYSNALKVSDDSLHKTSCEQEHEDTSNCLKTKTNGSLFLKDEFIVKCTVKTKNQVVRFTKFHPMSHALECKPTYPKFLFK